MSDQETLKNGFLATQLVMTVPILFVHHIKNQTFAMVCNIVTKVGSQSHRWLAEVLNLFNQANFFAKSQLVTQNYLSFKIYIRHYIPYLNIYKQTRTHIALNNEHILNILGLTILSQSKNGLKFHM